MKKLIIAALVALSVSVSAFATDQLNDKAVENFNSTYLGASNVQWSSVENLAKASFVQNHQKVEVFYSVDGDFVASTTTVDVNELPTYVKRNVAKNYSEFTVSEAFIFRSENSTSYYISLEDVKQSIVLKATSGSVSVYNRTSKI